MEEAAFEGRLDTSVVDTAAVNKQGADDRSNGDDDMAAYMLEEIAY